MENSDNMRTEKKANIDTIIEQSSSVKHFRALIKKVHPNKGLAIFCEWYVKEPRSHEVHNIPHSKASDRIRQQLNRNQVADIEKHLPFLERYCELRKVDCGFVGMPEFMINSLHDNPKIAREIFDALSSLDWSNDNDES